MHEGAALSAVELRRLVRPYRDTHVRCSSSGMREKRCEAAAYPLCHRQEVACARHSTTIHTTLQHVVRLQRFLKCALALSRGKRIFHQWRTTHEPGDKTGLRLSPHLAPSTTHDGRTDEPRSVPRSCCLGKDSTLFPRFWHGFWPPMFGPPHVTCRCHAAANGSREIAGGRGRRASACPGHWIQMSAIAPLYLCALAPACCKRNVETM